MPRAVHIHRWEFAISAPNTSPLPRFSDNYTETHLYDLTADPYELTNLAGLASHNDIRNQLAKSLSLGMAISGEPAVKIHFRDKAEPIPGKSDQSELRSSDNIHPLTS